ncbi:MAG: hypothetical protein CMN25_12465 [Salinicola sp.]|nr:hypothetical protein [Salinicola sp.]
MTRPRRHEATFVQIDSLVHGDIGLADNEMVITIESDQIQNMPPAMQAAGCNSFITDIHS